MATRFMVGFTRANRCLSRQSSGFGSRSRRFAPHPRVKVSIVGSLRDREVVCTASDRQGVLLAQFSLYVHKGGLKHDSFHFIYKSDVKYFFYAVKTT